MKSTMKDRWTVTSGTGKTSVTESFYTEGEAKVRHFENEENGITTILKGPERVLLLHP